MGMMRISAITVARRNQVIITAMFGYIRLCPIPADRRRARVCELRQGRSRRLLQCNESALMRAIVMSAIVMSATP